MDILLRLHTESTKADWFNEMNSLIHSDDPNIIYDIQDIMQTYKF